ncbi:glutathione peroxidase [Chitinimonas arctica]|uniref:Glutathione peroxidase n=1 Tax=Chitinimonas arctica TaxID=2594795 RepID=A0A516SHI9_9NEIS|nr:glutathione peroxidase [Chitinimonas arctica]QDQ27631.1 glutathione peroxidase [Chitinimonas arctica]
MSAPIYDFSAKRLDGSPESLEAYRGKVLLIVNTASECGFTPQFAGLEKLYQDYADKGFAVLGFPCNQFGGQEPGDGEQIGAFCQKNYGVDFPMFDKIEVNGDGTHPLYQYLKSSAKGLLGTEAIKWNFTKFLVDREGCVVDRFAPTTKPEELAGKISALL